MVIYIPSHLRKNIPILNDVSRMIETYNKEYSNFQVDSFSDYYEYYSLNTVKKFIMLCLNNLDIPKNNNLEDIINYLIKLFYSVKGSPQVFSFMKKFLGIKFKGDVSYTINSIKFEIEEFSTNDLQFFIDSLKDFLSVLLFYGDLRSDIKIINLNLQDNIKLSMAVNIQKYREYDVEEFID